MRHILLLLVSAAFLCLTGCPPQTSNTKPEGDAVTAPAPKAAPAPKPKIEPATEEARELVALIADLSGKTQLTPEGTIKSIDVSSSSLTEESFQLFAKQPDLESLLVTNFRELNDSMIDELVDLKKLKKLAVTNSGITNAGIKTIVEAFPNLTSLNISSNTLLNDAALKEVVKLQDLEQLIINYCDFSEFGIMGLTRLSKLKDLDIRANMQIGNVGMGFLAKIPSLQSLKHRSPAVDDSGMESLSAAKNLQTLEIQDFNITDASGASIAKMGTLTYLSIFRCQGFGSVGLMDMKDMKLNRLDLRDLSSMDDTGMKVFLDMTTLKKLNLTELASVSDAGMINLVNLKDLESLLIREIGITDAAMETLSKLSNLKELTLQSTEITDAAVDTFLAMPKLERLTLKDNVGLTDAAKEKLKAKKFKKLDFGP